MTNDLISREALKRHKVYSEERHEYVVPVYNIDNAPTVEAYPFEQVQELVKLNQQFAQEIENLKRQTGEWIIHPHSMIMRCSLCGHEETATDIGVVNLNKHFCSNCGADMRGGRE